MIYMDSPLLSVILPTYNGARFVAETLQSVVDQTYKNLEIIIVDDCSTDNTADIIRSFKDARIRFYQNDHNLGISENSNKALGLASGKYVMIQDHDDISMPVRAEMIIKFLESNPHITGCGTRLHQIGLENDDFIDNTDVRVAMDDEEIDVSNIFDRLITHPTVIYRRSILGALDKPYTGEFKIVSDDDFFHRLNLVGARWCFLDNKYLKYRRHGMNTSRRYRTVRYPESIEISVRAFSSLLPFATAEDIRLHALIQAFGEPISFFGKYNSWSIDWYKRIIQYNLDTGRFNHEKLLKTMARYWHRFPAVINAASPFKAFEVYRSIDDISEYLPSNSTFFKQWQQRFFRCIKWKFIRNKNLS